LSVEAAEDKADVCGWWTFQSACRATVLVSSRLDRYKSA